jgi:hypothetical protein
VASLQPPPELEPGRDEMAEKGVGGTRAVYVEAEGGGTEGCVCFA